MEPEGNLVVQLKKYKIAICRDRGEVITRQIIVSAV